MRNYIISITLRGTGVNTDTDYIPNDTIKVYVLASDFIEAKKEILRQYPNAYNIFPCTSQLINNH